MNDDRFNQNSLRYGILILSAMVLILGLRVRTTLATVIRPAAVEAPAPTASSATAPAGDDAVVRQRQQLASQAVTSRDPFRRPETGRLEPGRLPGDAPVVVRRWLKPRLSSLIHDNHDPMTQITVRGRRSGWLRRGDTFRGWTVTRITPRTVTITKGGKRVILP